MRVRDSNWRNSWLYSDSNSFAFCEWPDIDSTRIRRLAPSVNAQFVRAWTDGWDPERPTVSWAPLAALGDFKQVAMNQYKIGDLMRVRSFGIKCMNGVSFSVVTHNAATGAVTVLKPIPGCQNLAVNPYDATIYCDWWLTRELVLGVPFTFDPWVWVAGLAGGALLVGAAGWIGTISTINASPLATLRRV
jgi:hypothetical protein